MPYELVENVEVDDPDLMERFVGFFESNKGKAVLSTRGGSYQNGLYTWRNIRGFVEEKPAGDGANWIDSHIGLLPTSLYVNHNRWLDHFNHFRTRHGKLPVYVKLYRYEETK